MELLNYLNVFAETLFDRTYMDFDYLTEFDAACLMLQVYDVTMLWRPARL